MITEDAIGRIKKRRHAEFCVFERQVKTELKRVRKIREENKVNFRKIMGRHDSRKARERNSAESSPDASEELDMSIAAQEGLKIVYGEFTD